MCFSPQGLAREYREATKGWAILSLSLEGIRRERMGEERGVSLPTRGQEKAREGIGEKLASFCYFFF